MNSLNHVLIGTIVYEYIKEKYGFVLDKPSFLKGNTCPDHSIAFLRPHRMRYCNGMVRRKTRKLCYTHREVCGKKISKKIGILCHYYADFFCRAHNPHFGGSLKDHVRYEDELLRYMDANFLQFCQVDYVPAVQMPKTAAEISERMRSLFQQKPMQGIDYGTELLFAVQACAELVVLVLLKALSVQNENPMQYLQNVAA